VASQFTAKVAKIILDKTSHFIYFIPNANSKPQALPDVRPREYRTSYSILDIGIGFVPEEADSA
jgi:hypothetical protein